MNYRLQKAKKILRQLLYSREYRKNFPNSFIRPWALRTYFNLLPKVKRVVKPSELSIDVVILAVEKDLETLPFVIDGIKKNVKHPISSIFLVSPALSNIQIVGATLGCTLIDERSILSVTPEDLNIIAGGVNRSNWYYQQFLKWSGGKFTREKYYLVVDADTIFIRPQVFELDGKIILNCSDEYHEPYFDHYEKILQEKPGYKYSFTSHQMLFENSKLVEIKSKIETLNNCMWYEAILKNIDRRFLSGASDYEIYGQYVYNHYADQIMTEFWFNLSLPRSQLKDFQSLEMLYSQRYKSISFHSYNKR